MGKDRKSSRSFPQGQAGPWGGCREPLCPAQLSGAVVRRSCPAQLSSAVVLRSCPAQLSGTVVRRSCPAQLSGAVVWRSCPAQLSGAVVRRCCRHLLWWLPRDYPILRQCCDPHRMSVRHLVWQLWTRSYHGVLHCHWGFPRIRLCFRLP